MTFPPPKSDTDPPNLISLGEKISIKIRKRHDRTDHRIPEQDPIMICFFLPNLVGIKRWLRSPRYVTTGLGPHNLILFLFYF